MRKSMAILQSILSFAVAEELVQLNAAAPVRKPRYKRARNHTSSYRKGRGA